MGRGAVAAIGGGVALLAYLVGVLELADHVTGHHWALDLMCFAVAGIVWTWPAARLIRWVQDGRT
ncbi:DUF2842 domain-containing protein [Elioraea rosea]|uniref:DUF2842 domain-containing protein n=1 Tax=Elioraea rosea TaxID=2492390 RepID=UPI0011840630|nr:DUF2842 domain-containing protein [Elioraea rosea]